MRVIITGATGFLGGAVARALAEQGAEVHALARSTADRRVLEGIRVTWHEGDITVKESLSDLFEGAEWIVHAAGRLGQAGVPEEVYQRVNSAGTRNVMVAALATSNKPRVLHLSSTGILGPTGREPASEDAPIAPTNAYERSKALAERVALEFAARGLPVVVARPGFVYGPGDRHVLGLFRAVQSSRFFYIDGGGHMCQPTFVADAVAGMLGCLRRGKTGQIYNLVGPNAVSFRQLGETMAAALGVQPPRWSLPRWLVMLGATGLEAVARINGGRPPLSRTGVAFFSEDRLFSWQKAHRELGYTPQHDLMTGLSISIAWYRRQGSL
jgi:nucleoside-diphosphate-sugar epimerase